MPIHEKSGSIDETRMVFLVVINAIVLQIAFTKSDWWYSMLLITVPLLAISVYDVMKEKFPFKKKKQGVLKSNNTVAPNSVRNPVFTNNIATISSEPLAHTGLRTDNQL